MIKVKGNAPTVTVSWKKKNEEGEDDDTQTTLDASDQMTAKKMTGCGKDVHWMLLLHDQNLSISFLL